jgi:hypothetical protein
VFGWLVSLAVVVTVTVLATGNRPPRPHTAPASTALAAFCVLSSASYLSLEIYACLWTGQSQASLARFRAWIDSHTDQLLIAGSLIVGSWLIGKSIYLIVS